MCLFLFGSRISERFFSYQYFERPINIFTTRLEPVFSLFEIVIERASEHTVELHASHLRIRSEGLAPVAVSSSIGELVLSVVNHFLLHLFRVLYN